MNFKPTVTVGKNAQGEIVLDAANEEWIPLLAADTIAGTLRHRVLERVLWGEVTPGSAIPYNVAVRIPLTAQEACALAYDLLDLAGSGGD